MVLCSAIWLLRALRAGLTVQRSSRSSACSRNAARGREPASEPTATGPASSRSPTRSRKARLQPVEAARVGAEDLLGSAGRDVPARPQLAYGERLAVAVRHVRGEQELVLAEQLDRLRQQGVLDLTADVHLPRLQVLAGLLLHRERRCARARA